MRFIFIYIILIAPSFALVTQTIPVSADINSFYITMNKLQKKLSLKKVPPLPKRVNFSMIRRLINSRKSNEVDFYNDILSYFNRIVKKGKVLCLNDKACIEDLIIQTQRVALDYENATKNRILYPGGKSPFRGMAIDEEDLNNFCNKGGHSFFSFVESGPLFNQFSQMDNGCKSKITEDFIRKIHNLEYPPLCKKNKDHRICQEMNTIVKELNQRAQKLLTKIDKKEQSINYVLEVCQSETGLPEASFLEGLYEEIEKFRECHLPKIGDKRKVKHNSTTIPANYTLERKSKDKIEISVDIIFKVSPEYNGKNAGNDELVIKEFQSKVNKCLALSSSQIKTNDNKNIQLKANYVSEENKKAKVIKIGEKERRSNSRHYSASISCPSITHEYLHLLGLADEYEEHLSGYYVKEGTDQKIPNENGDTKWKQPAGIIDRIPLFFEHGPLDWFYNGECRVTNKNPSMMNQHGKRWRETFGKKYSKGIGLKDYQPSGIPLLDPGHTNFILYSGCKEKSEKFIACQKFTRMTPFSQKNNKCPKWPEFCQDGSWKGYKSYKEYKNLHQR
jgi:hypothetical protein